MGYPKTLREARWPGGFICPRCGLHSRAACRSRGPCRSRPLGGGSPLGLEQHAHCDAGRTKVSIHPAGEGRKQGDQDRGPGIDPEGSSSSHGASQILDLGSRWRDGGAQEVLDSHGCSGLLLRSPKPMATRNERKHEPPAAPVLPERHGSVRLHASGPEPNCPSTKSATAQDA